MPLTITRSRLRGSHRVQQAIERIGTAWPARSVFSVDSALSTRGSRARIHLATIGHHGLITPREASSADIGRRLVGHLTPRRSRTAPSGDSSRPLPQLSLNAPNGTSEPPWCQALDPDDGLASIPPRPCPCTPFLAGEAPREAPANEDAGSPRRRERIPPPLQIGGAAGARLCTGPAPSAVENNDGSLGDPAKT